MLSAWQNDWCPESLSFQSLVSYLAPPTNICHLCESNPLVIAILGWIHIATDVSLVLYLNSVVCFASKVLLTSDKAAANFSDRSLLKNLGHWLGMITLAKNKPILYTVSYLICICLLGRFSTHPCDLGTIKSIVVPICFILRTWKWSLSCWKPMWRVSKNCCTLFPLWPKYWNPVYAVW